MPRVNFTDGDSMTAGKVEIQDDWVRCLCHVEGDDGTYTETLTLIPTGRIESIVSTTDTERPHRVSFNTE
jgi:hypothetical protein